MPITGGTMSKDSEITLMDVVNPFYTQALVFMGVMNIPDMETKKDLKLAKRSIDTIEFLKNKMQGNLEKEEEKQIDEILMQMQMLFVKAKEEKNNPESKEDNGEEK